MKIGNDREDSARKSRIAMSANPGLVIRRHDAPKVRNLQGSESFFGVIGLLGCDEGLQ